MESLYIRLGELQKKLILTEEEALVKFGGVMSPNTKIYLTIDNPRTIEEMDKEALINLKSNISMLIKKIKLEDKIEKIQGKLQEINLFLEPESID